MSELTAKLKVEAKVWAATTAAFIASVAVSLLNAVQDNHALLGSLPGPLQAVILIVAPTAVTFLAGWAAKHTPRPVDEP
ncbi:holin [Streptomyces sp. NPDC052207]|uniref:holin n=1 Tax=Streptomyces sp. NPDC052207 TaxID=3155418 RepID=UPI00343414DB